MRNIGLGANVIGADIDPIPVVQARATLTQAALGDLRAAFNQSFAELYGDLGHYFQTECPTCEQTLDFQYTLHGLRKSCACGEVVQIDQYDLRHEADRKIRIWPESWEITDSQSGPCGSAKATRLITKAEKTCPVCEQKYQELLNVPYTPLWRTTPSIAKSLPAICNCYFVTASNVGASGLCRQWNEGSGQMVKAS